MGGTTVEIAYVAATGTFTITNDAGAAVPMAQADLDTLVRGITYENADQDPVAGDRTLTVTATDAGGLTSAPAIATITVVPVNDPPVGVDDAASIGEDGVSVDGNVLTLAPGIDTDVDGGTLTVSAAMQGTVAITIGSEVTLAGGGKLTLKDDGSYTFTPGTAYNGLDAGETATETIEYTVSDGKGGFDTALLVITIQGANDTPVVIDPANPGTPENPIPATDPLNIIPDVSTTDGASLVTIDVTGYIVDPDGEPLTFVATGLPVGLSIHPETGIITGTLAPTRRRAETTRPPRPSLSRHHYGDRSRWRANHDHCHLHHRQPPACCGR